MKTLKLFAFIFLGVLLSNCEEDKNALNNLFSIDTSQLKQVYSLEDEISVSIKNDQNKPVDSIQFLINGSKIGTTKATGTVTHKFKNEKFGNQKIEAEIFVGKHSVIVETNVMLSSNVEPKLLKYTILNTYPHDITAYTQGLEFFRDTIYEGTGNGSGNGTGKRGTSSLRKVNYKTGEVYKKVELAPIYFGEGITILNNKVYQLTYQNNEGYIYDADTFKKLKTFPYFKKMEGWGLTNDGEKLYMSDGTEKIYILNSETLEKIDYINVYTKTAKIESLNELEWIDNKIWANIYGSDALAVINPKNGAVEAVLNLSELKSKVTQHPDIDVLNGIAYNPKTKTYFVTGKNWDKMFEIAVEK
jgi:glutamine cyclotransferase